MAAYVIKSVNNKGYVAMTPWRYTQMVNEAESFPKITSAISFVRLNLPKMFQSDKFYVVKKATGAVVMTDICYDAKAVAQSSVGKDVSLDTSDKPAVIKGKSRMYYKVEEQLQSKKDSLKSLINSMDDIGTLAMEMSQVDKEVEDMKHYIEFSCLNAAEGYKAFKKMQDLLLKRRAIKDKTSIATMLEQQKISKPALEAALTYIETLGNRDYEVRADTGLFSDLPDLTPKK